MKRFTVLKNTFEDKEIPIHMLKALVGNRLEIEERRECLIFWYSYDKPEDIDTLFLSLGNEFMVDITGYTSVYPEQRQKQELSIALDLIENLPAGMYCLKTALLHAKQIDRKKMILDFILESSGIDYAFIRGFAENNLNVSQASKAMYIHRNTMNYKLDKLKELSGFDLRSFLDAYVLYQLATGK